MDADTPKIEDPDGLDAVLAWVPKMVTRYRATTHSEYDDAVQEGRAAAFIAWLKADTSKAPRDFYARRRANNRVASFVSDRPRPLSSEKYNSGSLVDRLIPTGGDYALDQPRPDIASVAIDRATAVKLLSRLDDRQREVVYRKFWLDQMAAQIAESMGMSSAWVSSRWLAIRNILAAEVGAEVKVYAGRSRG